ncbi:RNA polymerase sigma factor [Verrucomicrobiales bacterium BCK34]|nr:RNA polymerase sigma factor [Verrucomicrobiales bacterium BCK34]
MEIDEDTRCMERLREGDDLALNDLMRRWKKPLVSFCMRSTGNLTDAHEIAQETFVKVYSARKRYRQTAKFSTWLFTIANNLCRMRGRWRKRHPEILDSDQEMPSAEETAKNSDPASQSDQADLSRDLDRAIQHLPQDLHSAFVLYELHGKSCREIATIQHCTAKAVERRLARAREKLRSLLENKWAEKAKTDL